MLVGFFPRVSAIVIAYAHLSLQFRNPFILNSGDRLFMILAALSIAMPLGHKLSVDGWIRRLRGKPEPAPVAIWGQRLIQLQIAYVYLSSCVAKLANLRWRQGIALRDVLASPVFAEWPMVIDFMPLIWFHTYSTLVFELGFPLLVWFRRWRPYVLLAGIGFHVGIDVAMVIPIFSAIMIVSYAAFLTDSETRWLVGRLRRPFARAAPAA
jgi:hypothetical protein